MIRMVTRAAAAGLMALPLLGAVAHADDALGTPVGHVTIKVQSADIGIGRTWGSGRLTFQHHTYRFRIDGGSVAAVGYSKVTGSGEVYNLHAVKDFEGSYAAVNGEATAGSGVGGIVLSNPNGVKIKLVTQSKGGRLAAAAQGMKITLAK